MHINLGYLARQQGREAKAIRYYEWAQRASLLLDDDEYGQNLRAQIAWALEQLRVENKA